MIIQSKIQRVLITLIILFFAFTGCKKEDTTETDKPIVTTGDDRQLGLTPTPAFALQAIPLSSVPVYAGTLPPQYLLSFPQPAFQGGEGSCVAFACAYGVMSFHKGSNFSLNDGSIDKNRVYSPEYVYNQTKVDASDCSKGSYLVSYAGYKGALDLLVEKGVCTWNDMSYSYTNGCNIQPNSAQNSAAANSKIERYERVLNFSTAYLKSLIVQGKPIIVAAEVDAGFMNANSSYVWNGKNGTIAGYHAMVVIGYDDAKNAFKLLNSWGQTWGDGGYGWLDYDYFEEVVVEAYITYAASSNNNNDDDDDNNNNSSCSAGNWGYWKIVNTMTDRSYNIYFNRLYEGGFANPDIIVPANSTHFRYNVGIGTHTYQIYDNKYGSVHVQSQFRIDSPCDTITLTLP